MEIGKLYRVKALHPSRVSEPADLVFYPSKTIHPEQAKVRLEKRKVLNLSIGDVVFFLGDEDFIVNGKTNKYPSFLVGTMTWSSNCIREEVYKYYEFEDPLS